MRTRGELFRGSGSASGPWFLSHSFPLPSSCCRRKRQAHRARVINVAFVGALVVPVVRWKQREAGKRRRAYVVEHPRWRSLRKRWEDSYYCHKDGIVFVPEQAGSMTAPEFAASTARAS